jgi:hypothetical protein
LKAGSFEEFQDAMKSLSWRYSPPSGVREAEEVPILAPLHYVGGSLEFTVAKEAVLPHLLSYAEALADRTFVLARDASTSQAEKEKATQALASILADTKKAYRLQTD